MEIQCPSGLIGRVRKIKGHELSALAEQADGESTPEAGIATVVGGCWEETVDPGPYGEAVVSLGAGVKPTWKRVLKGDLLYALFRLRAASVKTPDADAPGPWGPGDPYFFDVKCEKCPRRYPWELLLSQLKMKSLPESSKLILADAAQSFTANVGGRRYAFVLQSPAADEGMTRLRKQQKRRTATIVDTLTAQTTHIDGRAWPDIRQRWTHFVNLDNPELQDLREAYEAADCGVETEIQTKCPECRWVQDLELPLGKGFFAPRRRPVDPELETTTETPEPTGDGAAPSTPTSSDSSSGASTSSGGGASPTT